LFQTVAPQYKYTTDVKNSKNRTAGNSASNLIKYSGVVECKKRSS